MPLSREFILEKFKNTNCVGICGVATAGKDTFFTLLKEYLAVYGIQVKRYALADKLKDEIDPYLKQQFGISAWTTNPEDKKLIRPSLVAHGFVRRMQTKGTYWTKQLEEPIRNGIAEGFVPVVTDIRYAEYDEDEIYWVRKFGGKLVYITRFYHDINSTPSFPIIKFVQPPNEDERRNDPKLRAQADYIIEWDTVAKPTLENLGVHIENFIKAI
jgi:hypothetical protein